MSHITKFDQVKLLGKIYESYYFYFTNLINAKMKMMLYTKYDLWLNDEKNQLNPKYQIFSIVF